MGGFMGVAAKQDCVFDLYFGIDYHSHLGTRRGGMVVYDKEKGFDRSIHNIENAPFRTKFDKDMQSMKGKFGIGCISDYEPQPLMVRSHHGTYAITTVSKINNTDELVEFTEELASGVMVQVVHGQLKGVKGELVDYQGKDKLMLRIVGLGSALVVVTADSVEKMK